MIKNRNGATTSSISVFFLFPEFNHTHKFIVIRKKLRSLQQNNNISFLYFPCDFEHGGNRYCVFMRACKIARAVSS